MTIFCRSPEKSISILWKMSPSVGTMYIPSGFTPILTLLFQLSSLINLISRLGKANAVFANEIEAITLEIHNQIALETRNEYEIMIYFYHYLSAFLLKLHSNHVMFGESLHRRILEPFEQFYENYIGKNNEAKATSKAMLDAIDRAHQQNAEALEK